MDRITLFLMTQKGFKSLTSLLENFEKELIGLIVIGRDNNIENDYSNEIKILAETNNISYVYRNDKLLISTKYCIAISWRWLIPLSEKSTLITIHDSLLPKYRGFSPLVNQLLNREKYIGVSGIISDEEFDKGDIILQKKIEVSYPIRIADAIELISVLCSAVLIEIVNQIINKNLLAIPQNEEESTYSLWRDEYDYFIDWNKSSSDILNFIYAVGPPYKGAASYLGEDKIRIYDVEEVKDVKIEIRDTGKVIFFKNRYPVVVCKNGLLKITDAKYDETDISIFPLKKFRLRFNENPI